MKPTIHKITITVLTEESGSIAAERVPFDELTVYLREAGIRLSNSRKAASNLCSIDFSSFDENFRETIQNWPLLQSHIIEYRH
jgi:hypothetical protein